MNIFLVPYTWARHLAVPLVVAGAAVLAWWAMLFTVVQVGPTLFRMGLLWRQGLEGALFLSLLAGTIAFTSILAEGSLRRTPLWRRILVSMLAGTLGFFLTLTSYGVQHFLNGMLAAEGMEAVVRDASLLDLRHRLLMWTSAGFCAGFATLVVRRGRGAFSHLAGGLAAGAMGAASWHSLGYYGIGTLVAQDLYLAPACGVFVWGFLHASLTWGIPTELYAGWVRVLSAYRYGHRIPIDRIGGGVAERFVGHFPRGLDLFLPVEQGVSELHGSFAVDEQQRYSVRGLSQQPTEVKRFLERIKLHYDPRRPAPLETPLNMEDRILLGDGKEQTELEFLLLPREER